jgi:hypothetical protein
MRVSLSGEIIEDPPVILLNMEYTGPCISEPAFSSPLEKKHIKAQHKISLKYPTILVPLKSSELLHINNIKPFSQYDVTSFLEFILS